MDDLPVEVEQALALYPVLSAPRVTRVAQGWIHQTYRVEEGDRCYVLQQLNPVFSPAVHANIEAVTARLAERGVETPLLERTRDGALFADLGDPGSGDEATADGARARFRLMTWVDGVAFDTCSSTRHAASAGRLVARFHGALHDLHHDFAPLGFAFRDTAIYFEELASAVRDCGDHPLHAEVTRIAHEIETVASGWEPLGALPERVVHLDLKFNNILFRGRPGDEEAACLIDLDTLSRMPLWVELGDAWRSWCNRQPEHEPGADYDAGVFEASARAWLDELCFGLERAEIASLAHAIERVSIELAARFAADALRESYFGWNPDLFASSGAHNLSRAKGQLSLHAQARESRDERLRFLLG